MRLQMNGKSYMVCNFNCRNRIEGQIKVTGSLIHSPKPSNVFSEVVEITSRKLYVACLSNSTIAGDHEWSLVIIAADNSPLSFFSLPIFRPQTPGFSVLGFFITSKAPAMPTVACRWCHWVLDFVCSIWPSLSQLRMRASRTVVVVIWPRINVVQFGVLLGLSATIESRITIA